MIVDNRRQKQRAKSVKDGCEKSPLVNRRLLPFVPLLLHISLGSDMS